MLDPDFVNSLSENPEEAFTAYEAQVRRMCMEEGYNGEPYLNKDRYLCHLYAFIQENNVGPDLSDPTEMYDGDLNDYFPIAEKKITVFAARMALKTAKSNKLLTACSLTPHLRSEIRGYTELIRTKLHEIDLSERKKDALLSSLNAFEKEVDSNRTSGEKWASLYFAIKHEVADGRDGLIPLLKPLEKIGDAFAKVDKWLDRLPAPEEKLKIEDKRDTKNKTEEPENEIPF